MGCGCANTPMPALAGGKKKIAPKKVQGKGKGKGKAKEVKNGNKKKLGGK